MSTALLTDHYELTMLAAALRDGTAQRSCVFEVFARHLPAGRRYGVAAGTERLIDAIEDYHFGSAELDDLASQDMGIEKHWTGLQHIVSRDRSTVMPRGNSTSPDRRS